MTNSLVVSTELLESLLKRLSKADFGSKTIDPDPAESPSSLEILTSKMHLPI